MPACRPQGPPAWAGLAFNHNLHLPSSPQDDIRTLLGQEVPSSCGFPCASKEGHLLAVVVLGLPAPFGVLSRTSPLPGAESCVLALAVRHSLRCRAGEALPPLHSSFYVLTLVSAQLPGVPGPPNVSGLIPQSWGSVCSPSALPSISETLVGPGWGWCGDTDVAEGPGGRTKKRALEAL